MNLAGRQRGRGRGHSCARAHHRRRGRGEMPTAAGTAGQGVRRRRRRRRTVADLPGRRWPARVAVAARDGVDEANDASLARQTPMRMRAAGIAQVLPALREPQVKDATTCSLMLAHSLITGGGGRDPRFPLPWLQASSSPAHMRCRAGVRCRPRGAHAPATVARARCAGPAACESSCDECQLAQLSLNRLRAVL